LGGEARCSGVVGGDLTAGDLTGGEKIAGQHWPDLDAADGWGPVDPWAQWQHLGVDWGESNQVHIAFSNPDFKERVLKMFSRNRFKCLKIHSLRFLAPKLMKQNLLGSW
jgi:hypothetical protein